MFYYLCLSKYIFILFSHISSTSCNHLIYIFNYSLVLTLKFPLQWGLVCQKNILSLFLFRDFFVFESWNINLHEKKILPSHENDYKPSAPTDRVKETQEDSP